MIELLAILCMSQATYTNPVYAHNFPDPFLVQDKGTFYMYATHNGPKGFQVVSSTDLVNWTVQPPVGKPSWSSDQLWAPEVYEWKGKWYIFYSAQNPDTRKRDLAVSIGDGPLGPFKDHAVLVPGASENSAGNDNGAIDPTLYVENGQPYLLYIREESPRSIKIVKLASDFSKTEGPTTVLLNVDRDVEQGILDAPTLIKRDSTYWLCYSAGWFQSKSKKDARYSVWAAKSPSLLGPYKKPDKPFLEGNGNDVLSPGHQTIFQLPSGEWWIAYHGWNGDSVPHYGDNRLGRTLRIDRLEWTPVGPKVNGPTVTAQPMPKVSR